MNSANESADWEPLLEPNGKALPKRPTGGTGGLAGTNRRETKSLYQEKWGRIRLGVLVVLAFVTFYLSLSTITLRPVVHQMVVNVPEDDEDLPGPRGMLGKKGLHD
uniref:(northern house mosquito) hypothetical protein n=1 Tax=Culex pipiens TaxID=7175 RepID=A0A8D8IU74_CULPI